MIDNSEIETVMDALESCEDEVLAAQLLKEFNDRSKEWGRLMLNFDDELDHATWKDECDRARGNLDQTIEKILCLKTN